MGIIDAFLAFVIGLINVFVDFIRYILGWLISLLNATGL